MNCIDFRHGASGAYSIRMESDARAHDAREARRSPWFGGRARRAGLAALVLAGLMTLGDLALSRATSARFGALRAREGADVVPPRIGFSILETGSLTVREGLLFAGGDFLTTVQNDFSAFLVKHGETLLLFDTGLGRNVREQYRADMPLWRRPFFRYEEPLSPARDQLDAAGVGPIDRILLSHAHWDHASGLVDFPGVPVWLPAEELRFVRGPKRGVGGAWPSQVGSPAIDWRTLELAGGPYEGFPRSADLFGDGSVVVVPMAGHTPGSVGMFVRTDSGARFFFVGDVVWNAAALRDGRPKFFAARAAADDDPEATQETIEQIRYAMRRDPTLTVVPAHDGAVQRSLGYFPAWVR